MSILFGLAFFAVVLAVAGCGAIDKHAGPEPTPAPPEDADVASWRKGSALILSDFWDGHCVVSRDAGGGPRAQGDCLIWNGLAMAGMPCDLGDTVEAAVVADLTARGGALQRAPSLPDGASIDGALGLYRGVGDRVTRCGRADVWRPVLVLHKGYLDAHGGLLNAQDTARVTDGGTDAVLAAVMELAGAGPAPAGDRLDVAGKELVEAWTTAVDLSRQVWKASGGKVQPAACYRVHLGYEAARTLETAGHPVSTAHRDGYCAASAALDLPLTDHWCGRGDLLSWTRAFQRDVYEFRHQRCPEWESPDADGLRRPGLDEVLAQREGFKVSLVRPRP